MGKMLHERLRKLPDGNCDRLAGVAGVTCTITCNRNACHMAIYKALADEIEREYIPRSEYDAEIKRIIEAQGSGDSHRIMKTYAENAGMPMEDGESITKWLDRWFIKRPRFEDGEPVRFGDEIKWADYTARNITGFGVTAAGSPYVTCAFDGNGMSDAMIYGANLKRPAPKVLDADGVEIKVGDVVWRVKDGLEMKVRAVGKDAWEKHGCSVATLLPEDDWDCCGLLHYSGRELTHIKPDSLEKAMGRFQNILEDKDGLDYEVEKELWEVYNRLTALVEKSDHGR